MNNPNIDKASEKKSCYAFKEGTYKGGCKILTEKLCMCVDKVCPFYTTKEDFEAKNGTSEEFEKTLQAYVYAKNYKKTTV